jgi:hypothetical protein
MSDIISARCFGCGNIIKVPAGLGGKKARCPQCTNTITIPMPSDTQHDEIIPDADLPEVARDGVPVLPEEGDAPIPGQEPETPPEDPSESRRRGGTSVRGRGAHSASAHPRVQPRSGTQQRYPGGPKAGAPKSNTGMMVGIGMGVLALIILAVAVAKSGGPAKTPVIKGGTKEKDKEKETAPKNQPQYSAEEQALVGRLMDYTSTVNRGDRDQILKFFTYEPDDERKVRIRITQEIVDKKVSYENVKVTSVSTATGTIAFTHGGGSKTLQWKQVGDAWLIAEMPSP